MTSAYDPILELRKLGYTEREATFLYLVGVHSGYFLRRQYLAFIEREDGAMVQRFLQKVAELQHVQAVEYAAGRHIYHLKSKLIYRILGQEDTQNRRVKGDRQILARLMQVDYLLDHFGEQFLETSERKVAFLQEKLRASLESLPQTRYGNNGTVSYFPDRFPIAVKQESGQSTPLVTLVFIDDGLRSISAFVRWLEQHTQLLKALHRADVIYAAGNSRNFDGAEREFLRRFPPNSATSEMPRGLEHFLNYLELRTRYDRNVGGFSLTDLAIVREGMELYTSLEQRALLDAWKNGNTNEAKIRAHFEPQTRRISIHGYLLEYDYPTRAEGSLEYATLFYIPIKAPLDLYQTDYKTGVKLYVKRVFVLDDSKELLPQYLRFVRGVIDSEDLPLNVLREILQQNKVLTSIKTASVKKILSELKSLSSSNPEKYAQFIAEYNRPLKEGLYGDFANREILLELIRFKSTKVKGLASLAEAKARMQPEQKSLYYITGGTEALLRNSPLLEVYKKKDIEVLILDDDIDEIVFSTIDKYGEIDLKAANKGAASDDLKSEAEPEKAESLKPLLEKLKATLGDAVREVRVSTRLDDSPSVIVSDEDEPSARMRQMMQAMGQKNLPELKPTLEINPDHEILKKLLMKSDDTVIQDAAWLLLDQALLLEGVPLKDPATFVQRLNRVLNQSI
jgi:hypothetical protein